MFLSISLRQKKKKKKAKIKRPYLKLKSTFTAKETNNQTKGQPTKWEEIFPRP